MRRVLTIGVAALALAAMVRADTFRVTNLADSGTGSLRWAVDQANSHADNDRVAFDISGEIHTTSPIMSIRSVLIDGLDAVTIVANASPAALILTGSTSVVRNLAIRNTNGAGVAIRSDWCRLDRLHVGPASGDGIRVEEGTHNSITSCVVVGAQNGIVIEGGFFNEVLDSVVGRERDGTPAANRGDGIHADTVSDNVYVGGVRSYCSNNCEGFVRPQNVIANNGGVGVRIDGRNGHVIWNQIVENAGDGIVHGGDTGQGEYIDNWLARNGGNGISVLGLASAVLANTGSCNQGLLVDYGNDGLSAEGSPLLQDAPPHPVLTDAVGDGSSITVFGTIDASPNTSYVVAFHPQSTNCPREGDNFDWNPETATARTDAAGRATFSAVLRAHGEDQLYATITESGGAKMSEPSEPIGVRSGGFVGADVSVSTVAASNGSGQGLTLTFTTTVTNRGPAAALDVVVTFSTPALASTPPTDVTGSTVNLGAMLPGTTAVLRQSFLWPFGSAAVRYESQVTHDGGTDLDPSNDRSVAIYPMRRRAVR